MSLIDTSDSRAAPIYSKEISGVAAFGFKICNVKLQSVNFNNAQHKIRVLNSSNLLAYYCAIYSCQLQAQLAESAGRKIIYK